MKIGILGSGTVGQTLGTGFIKHGHQVKIGTNHEDKLIDWLGRVGSNGSVGSFAEAAGFGEIIVLAVKGTAALSVLGVAEQNNLKNKTIIDATNPIDDAAPVNGVIQFFTVQNSSLMEELQKKYPQAKFVKAFNSVGSALMVNPDFGGQKPTMFIAGNNDDTKNDVKKILDAFGWEVEDMGKAEAARAIEPLCILWCIPGFLENRWMHAFKLLKK
ncbi:MAG TPA: NAD(P)-binding domain-containing protein [Ignavibacteriaceae bacterium]|nr:NAD(P)-binding domain-containing protein [Ignavibacteriaceae bacterium]HRP91492.1 NAD(P)-binding domain-containing protein [Ignavibacteriaceae bacterium]HRQ54194.1 NAD(P)-binding domain-containing protein [Ignavibacteriaceae bacterium]